MPETPPNQTLRPVDDEARALAETLMRSARFGALGVREADGAPAVSRVNVATAVDGAVGFLASRLTPHFAALEADGRCSLLLGEPGKGDPLAHPRIALFGEASLLTPGPDRERFRDRFLRRHPKAALYADFGDMGYWIVAPARASLNGGYGRAYALSASDLPGAPGRLTDEAFAEAEPALVAAAQAEDGLPDRLAAAAGGSGSGWAVLGLDPRGVDLGRGEETRRLRLETPIADVAEAGARLRDAVARR